MNETRIEQLLRELTLEEKIGMIHGEGIFRTKGVERLGIPPLKMSDGPMGVRNEFEDNSWKPIGNSDDYVSYLPSNTALAATWNRKLAYEIGQVLGEEARGRGKDVILAPGINILRTPLCGRNFEYMSEDPYLISETVVPLIKGIEENDVAACVKHFVANNQETRRLDVNVEVSDRALREIYFPGFKAAVRKAKTKTIMGAYNKFRGQYCCHNDYLLNEVLRKEWGFDGTVISDWGGVHDTREAAYNGLDIEMSVENNFDNYYMANPLLQAVKRGEVEETVIEQKVRNILRLMERLNMLDGERKSGTYNTPGHRKKILEVAKESIVLLKNEDEILPLNPKKIKTLAVIGDNANRIHSDGGGSAEIKTLYEITPLMGLKMKLGGNVDVKFARGYYVDKKEKDEEINWQANSLEERISKEKYQEELSKSILTKRKELLEEAVAIAKGSDAVVLFGGLNHDFDSEGKDKEDMKLPYGQDELIEAVLKANKNAIVVMVAGSPVDMSSWADKAKSIIYSWYAGMEGGIALAEVLFGEVNPSGKLPETLPKKLEDSPAHHFGEFPGGDNVKYNEDIFVGYRYFETYRIEPQFCFGHGLSYTTFEYKDLQIFVEEKEKDLEVFLSLKIKNIGKQVGAEVVQVYTNDKEASLKRPKKELKAYEKTNLNPEEEKEIRFRLDKTAFGYYDENKKSFYVEPGEFSILVGSSVKDIRLKKEIVLSREYRYL
ncbi:MAG: glycosyl hydrolase [Epulopiscium sp.]|nr:glycosyl hydrolase [Candidatus Epulonipiscium sp.]